MNTGVIDSLRSHRCVRARVCAWERRCCQPAFVCVSAHASLFKHHMLVIWCRRTYGAEQNLVTLLAHCHIDGANIRPQPCRPHPVTPLFSFCHLPLSAGMDVAAVKEGPPASEPASLSGYRESLYAAALSVM